MQRYTVHYTGRVQGVGFRYTTVNVAEPFAVAGYVQNLADGRVKLVAEGEPKALDGLLAAVDQALGRYIREHRLEKSDATGEFDDFTIRH
ncbi:acylphosphatase [Phycisphaerales bacterium AB-hyl4]|uniref:acylphosphatase n=1 Tax=Natronomicrosphaera hydrolytica TaxID=3242702 RepID=A0ABV4U971_9BACT